MISIKWHNDNNSHIGKSTCGKYLIEILDNKGHFEYIIKENKHITHKSSKPHDSIEDAKRVISTLLSMKYLFI